MLALYTALVVLYLACFYLVQLRFGEIGVGVAMLAIPVASLLVGRLFRGRSAVRMD
ncbi:MULTISPECIES: hypothetical protein [unclassified Deinococcus]|uniref:hypothetical protein n=1 Tax=unclassified Deinococcus TaxID=2623546 RepID=UPI001304196A|nr:MULTISPECIES: hypothetical protein [unclassified Deinococcus]MCD0158600.1 hypothetical protein [Deinococcus sp. 6GRE01]